MKYPSLYQINTRVWLTELSKTLGRPATLDDIPDNELDKFAKMGFDWLWFLSVWTTGEKARKISKENPDWLGDYKNTLTDLKDADIGGSGFAIADYRVHPNLGGDIALERLRTRLKKRGLKLMLDFVPNHMGPDHPWVNSHPEYFITGTEADLKSSPQNYTLLKSGKREKVFAYGRDPYFYGWPDTVQLNFNNAEAVQAMIQELIRISGQCDGLRCDMAMLVLPDVFERTWGRKAQTFWPEAIEKVREQTPGFCFMAEVYWDMEWDLQQLGFDYTYDKRLYDRLEGKNAKEVREHFFAGLDFQNKMARFLENHDETRAAKVFDEYVHKAAAILTFLSPGFRFFHQGQFEGRLKRITPHLIRGPKEKLNLEIQSFYKKLLALIQKPVFYEGNWSLLQCKPAWENNESWNSFISFLWELNDNERVLVCVNYASYQSQCYVQIPLFDLSGHIVQLKDLTSTAHYEREGDELLKQGLYLDIKPWGYHVFKIS